MIEYGEWERREISRRVYLRERKGGEGVGDSS